jgi:hypothetical protein
VSRIYCEPERANDARALLKNFTRGAGLR